MNKRMNSWIVQEIAGEFEYVLHLGGDVEPIIFEKNAKYVSKVTIETDIELERIELIKVICAAYKNSFGKECLQKAADLLNLEDRKKLKEIILLINT